MAAKVMEQDGVEVGGFLVIAGQMMCPLNLTVMARKRSALLQPPVDTAPELRMATVILMTPVATIVQSSSKIDATELVPA